MTHLPHRRPLLLILCLAGIVFFFAGTERRPPFAAFSNDCLDLPQTYFNYANITLPQHLSNPNVTGTDNTPPDNPITDAGATLGRVLFYDNKLSLTNTQSCASCHAPEFGFSDDRQFSRGFVGGFTARNSMGLAMSRFYANGRFFWDERATSLEHQVLQPIQDPIEMGLTLDELMTKLSEAAYYAPLFEAAFGTPDIDADRVAKALSQFTRSMVSYQAKFDAGRALVQGPPITPFPNFTTEENIGKAVFFDPAKGNCASCHGTNAFIAPAARNNGLDATTTDAGLGGVTGLAQDMGKFKVPSLRNIEVTGPFMHDGRFETLDEVIEHYNSGVQAHPNLAPQLRNGPGPNAAPRQLNLTSAEKTALKAFLLTLTDPAFLTDERWSDPFCQSPTSTAQQGAKYLSVKLFPNPATETITVQLRQGVTRPVDLTLLNVQGQTLFSATFTAETSIDCSQLPRGTYFLRLREGSHFTLEKVLVR